MILCWCNHVKDEYQEKCHHKKLQHEKIELHTTYTCQFSLHLCRLCFSFNNMVKQFKNLMKIMPDY